MHEVAPRLVPVPIFTGVDRFRKDLRFSCKESVNDKFTRSDQVRPHWKNWALIGANPGNVLLALFYEAPCKHYSILCDFCRTSCDAFTGFMVHLQGIELATRSRFTGSVRYSTRAPVISGWADLGANRGRSRISRKLFSNSDALLA